MATRQEGTSEGTVKLTRFEMNAAANALATAWPGINPRAKQETAADRAYYKLVDAAREFGGEASRVTEQGRGDAYCRCQVGTPPINGVCDFCGHPVMEASRV